MNLKKLEKKDISIISKYLNDSDIKHSSYSLSNIFLWDGCLYDVMWLEYEKYLIISENPIKSNEEKRIMLPLPYNKIKPRALCEIMNELNYDYVYYVTKDYIEKNRDEINNFFQIKENFIYSDYIYLSTDLCELKGSKYSSKRNLINQFEKNYILNTEIRKINKNSIDDIINLSKNIYHKTDKSNIEMLDCEIKAISKLKELYDEMDFFGITIYINNCLKGFAVGSVLSNGMCVCNFEKADKSIKGIYQFLDREFAALVRERFKYINKESDMGKENLKKAKLSYNPVEILDSYTLQIRK